MAAIVGILSASSEPDESTWGAAKEQLSARSGPWGKASVREGLAVAYRAHRPGGFFGDESLIVLVDGFIDNAASLAGASESDPGCPAAILARLLKERGIEALYDLAGNFAVAVVDLATRQVWLLRDRFGTTPLFYAPSNGGWCWGSEIKFLLPLIEKRELNKEALGEVFHYRWLAGERTLVRDVQQVLPSHCVELQPGSSARRHRYCVFRFQPSSEEADPAVVRERIDRELDDYFDQAAARYSRVGILLSGGVDSSLLAAKAMRGRFKKCVAITGRWPRYENPELPNACRVAKHLGIEHIVVDVEEEFVEQFFPELIRRMEEAPRHYHGFVLSKLFSRIAPDVDAILYGEAADTMLGTGEVLWLRDFERKQEVLRFVPWIVRRAVGSLLPDSGDSRLHALRKALMNTTETYLARMQAVENVTKPSELIHGLPREAWPNEDVLHTFCFADAAMGERYQDLHLYTEVRSHLDTLDRLSAPTGLAVLTPFLSPGIASIGSRLPAVLKIKEGYSKPLLREIACRYFPREWVYAEKLGFPTPLRGWMAGPLQRWLAILQEERTALRGLFRSDVLRRLRLDRDYQILWTALCLEIFLREFIDGEGNPVPVQERAQ